MFEKQEKVNVKKLKMKYEKMLKEISKLMFENSNFKTDLELWKEQNLNNESSKNNGNAITNENNDYQNKLMLLDQEIKKRYNELMLYSITEKRKLRIQHNQNLKKINLQ